MFDSLNNMQERLGKPLTSGGMGIKVGQKAPGTVKKFMATHPKTASMTKTATKGALLAGGAGLALAFAAVSEKGLEAAKEFDEVGAKLGKMTGETGDALDSLKTSLSNVVASLKYEL